MVLSEYLKRADQPEMIRVSTLWKRVRVGRTRGRSGRGEQGATLVEAAFVIPLILVLVLGVVDFGMMINNSTLLNNATREGAREGVFGSDASTIEARVREAAVGLKQADLTVSVTCKTPDGALCAGVDFDSEWEPGGTVVVDTTYTYHYLTPITTLVGLGETSELESDIEMRIEG